MSPWVEHTGMVDNLFKEPGSLACVSVNRIGEDNWEKFTNNDFSKLQGHLLKYPLAVDKNGKVSPLPGFETFLDVGGKKHMPGDTYQKDAREPESTIRTSKWPASTYEFHCNAPTFRKTTKKGFPDMLDEGSCDGESSLLAVIR
uniref:Phospholipase D delta-like n=1 Tax=Carica papaya TaxID=3649 RepID=A0A4D6D256_CARPA|nr:phospholipase D delta-like [Carica papaya]